MAKSFQIKTVVFLVILFFASISHSETMQVACQGYSGYCLPDCCSYDVQCAGFNNCSIFGCAVNEGGEEKGYMWYYNCPAGFPMNGCDWFATNNWQLGYPSCGLYAPMCGQHNACNMGKFWALCEVTYTCDSSRNLYHDGNCYLYGHVAGVYSSDICTQEVYGGSGCYALYKYCVFEPVECDDCGGDNGCELYCEYPQIPDGECAECICPTGDLECNIDMEWVSEACTCSCKPLEKSAVKNPDMNYDCDSENLNISLNNSVGFFTEIYIELYKCKENTGGGPVVILSPRNAYAEEECNTGWEWVADSYSGLSIGNNSISLEKGLYQLRVWFYRSPECWPDGVEIKTIQKRISCGDCVFNFKNEKIEALKEKLKTVFPFSLLIWADSFFNFQSGNNSTMILGLPVIGDVEVQFIDLQWFRTLLLALIFVSVIGKIMRKIL